MKKLAGLAALALATTLLGGTAQGAIAATTPTLSPGQPVATQSDIRASALDGYKRTLAERIARGLGDQTFRAALERELAGDGQADLAALFASLPGTQDLADYTRRANSDILKLKGLNATDESLLEVRIDPSLVKKVSGNQTLVMFTPSGDEKGVRTVVAYDSKGRTHELDAYQTPRRPVLIVGLNERKTADLSLQTIRQALTDAGVAGTDSKAETGVPQSSPSASLGEREVSMITAIELKNDHEPWYKGSPELYAWVAGAGTDGKARVDTVEMPYVKEENKTYRPNQPLIEWSNFSWTALDVVVMEHDDNADLSGLVKAVVEAALTVSGNGQYVGLADKIVGALPSDWVTDSDDWVDSCYAKTRLSTSSGCASRPVGVQFALSRRWI